MDYINILEYAFVVLQVIFLSIIIWTSAVTIIYYEPVNILL